MSTRDERSEWAEGIDSFGTEAKLTSGKDAAARGRVALEDALGGHAEVEKALRGRPSLTAGRKGHGHQSPKRTFRLTEQLNEQLNTMVSAQKRPQSEVMRDALAEYFDRHSA
ncbi:ribbon-helix-helix protein, CopG family [Paenarthrobacter sp. Z7-10]|uniref:ribbon-helix-helix protein, CopG family n=1 Tax=Paenarthrobacter sp. Z7-10 TaxID=2787635 RepID=UPI003FA7CC45|nr:ribbon-helix-helix protein, CopG family [Paenarthrobacter sp. Z7-10]